MRNEVLALLLAGMALAHAAKGQYTAGYTAPITVTNNHTDSIANYAALLVFDSQTLISSGKMAADLRDLRFADDCSISATYPYYIAGGAGTTTTQVWINMGTMPAGGVATIHMFYGDSSLAPVANFAATFPNALITGGSNYTLSGNQYLGWLDVQAGDTLFITTASGVLNLFAGYTRIDGAIYGVGAGYLHGGPNSIGGGPGGGGYSVPVNSGSGGGAYGGNGGTGGADLGDSPGLGGTAYGTYNGMDLNAGSAGGSSDNTAGGDGGGAVLITGHIIEIAGTIRMDATSGPPPGGARGGGGGAGGGLLLRSDSLTVEGTAVISAKGADGTAGTSAANDSGGGGGGGRSKMFHGSHYSYLPASAPNVNGGLAGPYGGVPGGPGLVGSAFDTTATFVLPAIGAEAIVGSSATILITSCAGTPVVVDSVTYSTDTTLVANFTTALGCDSTIITSIFFYPTYFSNDTVWACPDAGVLVHDSLLTTPGVYSFSYLTTAGCDSSFQVTLEHYVVDTGVYLLGGNTLVSNDPSAMAYQWIDCSTGLPLAGEVDSLFLPAVNGTYALILTTTDGCTDTSGCHTVIVVGAEAPATAPLVKAYPVPAQDLLTLTSGTLPMQRVALWNAQGQLLMQQEAAGSSHELQVAQLPAGIYLVKVQGRGWESTLRIVIE